MTAGGRWFLCQRKENKVSGGAGNSLNFLFLTMNLISKSMTEVVPINLPGLTRIHDSILKSGKSVPVLPGDEVILHPKKGFLVMNRRYTPWEMVDTPDPFFNLPADGYNSGRFVIGLANKRERERRFNAFAAGRAPTPPPPAQQPPAVQEKPLPTPVPPAERLAGAPSQEFSAPSEAPPPPPRARNKTDRWPADGGGSAAKRKKKRADAEGKGESERGRGPADGDGSAAKRKKKRADAEGKGESERGASRRQG
jgi:hypothetical protein